MNEALNQALTLLGVGMVSVFAVLSIVVLTGKVLVFITNRLDESGRTRKPTSKAGSGTPSASSMQTKELVVLTAVVDHLTHGKGRIVHVTRIPKDER